MDVFTAFAGYGIRYIRVVPLMAFINSRIKMQHIQLVSLGFQLIGPDRAIIRDEIIDWTLYEVTSVGDRIRLYGVKALLNIM